MKTTIYLILFFACINLHAYELKTIHEFDSRIPLIRIDESIPKSSKNDLIDEKLNKIVFAYHPYWTSKSSISNYDYSAISHLGLFSFEIDTITGSYASTHGLLEAALIDSAKKKGVKPILVVTNFGSLKNKAFLNFPAKRKKFIDTAIYLLKLHGVMGINIDFESVGVLQRDSLSSFMADLSKALKKSNPDYELSIAGPAVDWSGAYDLKAIAAVCDYIIVMGYDYSWSGSANAGPVAPLEGTYYCVSRSIDSYLKFGIAADKLLLGVPWYGYSWKTEDSTRQSKTLASATSITYASAEIESAKFGKIFDDKTKSVYYKYKLGDSAWYQTWYDDSLTLGLKYEFVNNENLAGIGIWALGYSNARTDLWQGLKSAFTTSAYVEELSSESNDLFLISGNTIFIKSTNNLDFTYLEVFNYLGLLINIYDLLAINAINLNPGAYIIKFSNSTNCIYRKILIN